MWHRHPEPPQPCRREAQRRRRTVEVSQVSQILPEPIWDSTQFVQLEILHRPAPFRRFATPGFGRSEVDEERLAKTVRRQEPAHQSCLLPSVFSPVALPFHQINLRFREFIREPEAVFWTFVFPILLAAGLGIAFRQRGPDKVQVGVVTTAPGAASVV